MNPLLEVLCNEINKLKKALTTTGSDYTATVTRVDGNTAYVQMSGSEIADTPVSMTINANVGDKVRVRVANGRAWITGNDTAPPADNRPVVEMIEKNNQGLIETEAKYSRIDQSIDEITIEVGEKMDTDMSNRASSITVNSGQIAFNSNSLVVNSSKFTLDANGNATFSGSLSAAGGTFAGNLSAAGGTFSGNLSAAGGTFSGDLNAAGGTFKGSLSAASGTFAGNLSAAGGTFSGNLSAAGGTFKGSVVFPWSSSVTRNIYINDTTKGAPIVIQGIGEGGLGALETSIMSGYIEVSQAYQDKSAILTPTGVQTFSDGRLKKDVKDINPEIAKRLRPVQFRFKKSEDIEYGFIAQEVQEIIPAAVNKSIDNEYLMLNYQELIAPLYALVQEQEDRIDRLEARLKALEEKKK